VQSKDKKCGILLAISSLPGIYGIGSFDKAAYSFIDFIKECRQDYWQILPLCPVGKGNSPYYSPASFAGEILYIDLEKLKAEGLISDIPKCNFPQSTDYKMVRNFKLPLIMKATENFDISSHEYIEFCKENDYWLESYSIFMTLKDLNGNIPFCEWSDKAKRKENSFIEELKFKHNKKINFYKISQFFFYNQYKELKEYANKRGIEIIGDIPFYVSPDSADVFSNPHCFQLNEDYSPGKIAGVPPDIFSSDGQLWGNPIYNWEYQRSNGYEWWKKRLVHNSRLYDILRIDHFRAFADYYSIESTAKNAKNGKWVKGEGMNFWNKIKTEIPNLKIIAEDLGGETEIVRQLVKNTGFPNMKLLQFAFDSDASDPFLPKNYDKNCVCYTGTHDNDTTYGWYRKLPIKEKEQFLKYSEKCKEVSPVYKLIELGMTSIADTVIIPLQDYLLLDSNSRLNTPGTEDNNWSWRVTEQALNETLMENIKRLSALR